MGEAGKRPFADDLGLADNFPEKLFEAGPKRGQGEAGVFAGRLDQPGDAIHPLQEYKKRRRQDGGEDQGLDRMQAFHHYHATL